MARTEDKGINVRTWHEADLCERRIDVAE